MSRCARCGYVELGHNAADRAHRERCAPINAMTKDEFFSVAKKLKPDLTRAEYDAMWSGYLAAKAEHERTKDLN